MPESSFPSAQQIVSTEIDQDSPVTDSLLEKIRLRDVTLIDQMAKHGGPSSVGDGSAVAYEGDVTISANQTLEGLHYYNNLTINAGVTVTTGKALIIIAKGTVTIAGIVNADGQGADGSSVVGVAGARGRGGAGGGGGYGSDGGEDGSAGGDCEIGSDRVAGGAGGTVGSMNGVAPAALSTRIKGAILIAIRSSLHGGAGGGSGGGSPNTAGGAGGGVILIIAPTVVLTGGSLLARGAAGSNGATNDGGGGGGGGGVIAVACKSYVAGTLDAAGGAGGSPTGSAGNGASGGAGVIQIDIYS